MRKIRLVCNSEKDDLRCLLYEYLKELSLFDDKIKFGKNGEPIYRWFDCYFKDSGRYPFYFVVDGKVAGFALIRQTDIGYEIGEFYVLQSYRKDGNALWFANEVLRLFKGEINFFTKTKNERAVGFWNKFVKNENLLECSCVGDEINWRIIKD